MSRVRHLSYTLEETIPAYGKTKVSLGVRSQKSIDRGDSCNTIRFSMENHWGTHIDAPAHFFKNAKTITDYPAESWAFKNPCVVKLAPEKNGIIGLDEIKTSVGKKHDLLLLKTGFGRFRGLKVYSFSNPAVSPEIGLWLRSKRPGVRAIGFDFISLGSHKKRELARQSHRAFLNPRQKGWPILIIEDMDLSYNLSRLKMVWVAPLLIKGIDSAPCTVFGIFN